MWPSLVTQNGAFAVFMFRLSAMLYSKGKLGWALSMLLFKMNIFISGCEIWPTAKIGAGLILMHPVGVVIASVTIGEDVQIFQCVTLGRRNKFDNTQEYPTIGDNSCIYAGAVILGGVKIGKNCQIGANTVVNFDVPDNAKVVPAKSRIIA